MKQTIRALLLVATATIAFQAYAAEKKDPAATGTTEKSADTKDYTIIKIGSEEIKNSDVLATWKGLFPNGSAPDFSGFDENVRQNVLRGLVSEHLIYAEAVKAGVDKDPEVKKRIAAVEKQVVMQNFIEAKSKTLVTDEQLHAAYAEKQAAAKGQEEVKASHILVATEEEAKKLSAEIKKGADFEKLAKDNSTDKGSSTKGGELGWFSKDKMVPEFADAAFKLKKGEVSDPIKSEFGWHIIKVEDRRPLQIASFDEMKEQLRGAIANKAVQSYVESLIKSANVKYYGPDGKEKTLSLSLNPPEEKGTKLKMKPAADQ